MDYGLQIIIRFPYKIWRVRNVENRIVKLNLRTILLVTGSGYYAHPKVF